MRDEAGGRLRRASFQRVVPGPDRRGRTEAARFFAIAPLERWRRALPGINPRSTRPAVHWFEVLLLAPGNDAGPHFGGHRSSLGIVGVLLVAIGVYGVTSYMVARRTREIGIRIALSADRPTVARMAIAETLRLIVIGAAVGLPLAVVAARLLRAMLFGLSPLDPWTFAGTTALFALVGLVASYLPVRRALAIDPSRALRYE